MSYAEQEAQCEQSGRALQNEPVLLNKIKELEAICHVQREALEGLKAVKNLKAIEGKSTTYLRCQPIAWDRCFKALSLDVPKAVKRIELLEKLERTARLYVNFLERDVGDVRDILREIDELEREV